MYTHIFTIASQKGDLTKTVANPRKTCESKALPALLLGGSRGEFAAFRIIGAHWFRQSIDVKNTDQWFCQVAVRGIAVGSAEWLIRQLPI